MKEYFVIADPHSFYTEMMKALIDAGFDKENPEHIVIGCGDYLDRGKESKEVVDFLYDLFTKDRVILVRGNHEDLFDELVTRKFPYDYDVTNGTIKSLGGLHRPYPWTETKTRLFLEEAIAGYDRHWDVLRRAMVNFYERDHYIFVHGWIPMIMKKNEEGKTRHFYDPNWRNATPEQWKEARWENGMFMASLGLIEKQKTIVCGHWHTSWGNVRHKPENANKKASELSKIEFQDKEDFHIYRDTGVIGLDACTGFTKYCNCLKLTEEEI